MKTVKEVTEMTCDNCGVKQSEDTKNLRFGSPYFSGWYHVDKVSNHLSQLCNYQTGREPSCWDFCGIKCLLSWAENKHISNKVVPATAPDIMERLYNNTRKQCEDKMLKTLGGVTYCLNPNNKSTRTTPHCESKCCPKIITILGR